MHKEISIGAHRWAMEVPIKITDRFKKEAYSRFVHENPTTSIFQTLDMAEVYKRSKGCTPLSLVAVNEDTGEILASLLARKVEEKQGFLSSFSRHSTIRGGPIFVDSKEGIKAVSLLLEYYNKIVEREILYSRIYPLNNTPQIIPSIMENGYEQESWQNFLIDLTKSKKELWSNLKKDKKRGINKAKKFGVQIHECEDRNQLQIFYNLLKERFSGRKYLFRDISTFEAVFDILVPRNEAKFLFAKYNDEYIAARLILLYKGVIYAWYIGSSNKYLRYHPNDLLVWHVLEWGSENGYHTFDFGGGGIPGETSGWIEFKRRFGGKIVNYGRYTKIHQPKKLWLSQKMFEIYRRLIYLGGK